MQAHSAAETPTVEPSGSTEARLARHARSAVPRTDASSRPSATPLSLTIIDTINRALQHNLGILNAEEAVARAKGTRWTSLADLLPNVSGRVSENRQVINLAAFGFNPIEFGFPSIVGPFSVFDARVNVSQTIGKRTPASRTIQE